MSFVAAVEHLHALGLELASDLAAPTAVRRKFDLDHMRILARALGDPQTQFPAVLIAGTNGKGSTAATLAAILGAAGYRTGLYTSPHLSRVTERIRVSESREQGTALREQQGRALWPDSCSLFPVPCLPVPRLPVPCLTEIPEPDFARLYFRIDDVANQLVSTGQLPHHPSFFETLTALAFLYFSEQRLDIAILEVGMGGRLDATNIVEPILSVITDIALDHQDYLGATIAAIAREKAGILRAGGTLITLPQHPDANHAIGEAAIALNVHAIAATDYLPGRNFTPPPSFPESGVILSEAPERAAGESNGAQSKDLRLLPANHYDLTLLGETLHVRSPLANTDAASTDPASKDAASRYAKPSGLALSGQPGIGALAPGVALPPTPLPANNYTLTLDNQPLHIRSPLAGEHQQRNLALAIAAAIELRNYFSNKSSDIRNQHSYNITNSAIEAGIAATSWPGRLEFLPPNLLLDVAHNPAGAWTLRAAIATLPEELPRTLIFSCLRDKDLTEMAQILFPLFDSTSDRPHDHIVLTPIHNPRAASLEDLLSAARKLSIPAHAAEDPAEALALARSLTPAHGIILASGSIYLVGALREAVLAQ